MVSVLFASMLLLTMTQPAIAADVSTNVVGIGDTRDNALTLISNQPYDLFIANASDVDWYKWTNNSGKDRWILLDLRSNGGQTSLDLAAQIKYTETRESTLLYAEPTKPGSEFPAIIRNLYVPQGATLYVRASANKFVTQEQYRLNFIMFRKFYVGGTGYYEA